MKIAMIEDDNTISFAVQTFLKRYDMETEVFGNLTMTEKIDFLCIKSDTTQYKLYPNYIGFLCDSSWYSYSYTQWY